MKNAVKKADIVIILCLVIVFGTIIFMNTRLINNMMLNQLEKSSQNRLEIIRSDYENISMEVEQALLKIVYGTQEMEYKGMGRADLETYIRQVGNDMIERSLGVIRRVSAVGPDWQILTEDDIPSGYHPQEQTWYTGALSKPGELYFAEPYYDVFTGERCFTVAMALSDGQTVIGMDMALDGISEYIERMSGDEHSVALIITDDGIIVGSTNMEDAGKSVSEAMPEYAAVLSKILQSSEKTNYFDVNVAGEDVTAIYSIMRNGWYMALFLDDESLYGDAITQRWINIIVNLLLLLLIIVSFIASARNRIKAQEALRSREAFIGQILGNLHEPLGRILRLSDMERFNNSNDIKADMADIKASSLELKEMMDNLRSYSTIVSDAAVNSHARQKKRHELARSIKIFRNVIIVLLILVSGISMYFYIHNRNSAVRESVMTDLEKADSELNQWLASQHTAITMFTDVLTAQPEILDDYEGAVKWLDSMSKNYAYFSVCYVANPDSENRIIMNTGWKPEDDFDFTQRDWYINAIEAEGIQVISEPYIEVTEGEYCITISQAMYDKFGKFIGVFGMDIYLDKLIEIFRNEVSDDKYAFLVDSYGNILNHPNPVYQMTDDRQVRITDTPYAGVYLEAGSGGTSPIRNIRDFNDEKSLCVCRGDSLTGFAIVIVGNWWMMYKEIIVYCALYIFFVGSGIVTVIILLNRVIRSQADMNRELAVTADRAMAAGQAKSDFLAQMSHEIRTPINAVIGMDEMILRESGDPEIREYAENIKSASQTLLSLINGILDFSKIESGKMEIIRVRYETLDLLDSLVNMISDRTEKKGLNLILDIDPKLPRTMFGDDVRIRQVITNLLTNAVKYTPKGDVTLSVHGEKGEGDDYILKVAVKDTGIGIKAEDKEKLFLSFQRLDEERNRNIEGTGLGMSIVQGLLGMMDSKLEVESEYGKGSTFAFSLVQKVIDAEEIGEYSSLSVRDRATPEARKDLSLAGARILVVDDNDMNLKVARGLLKRYEVVPELCDSGRKSLDLVKEKQYDLILMDHMMPGMDGVEVLKEIRKQNLVPEEVPIIALTANAIVGAREEYLSYGFKDYLSKPIDTLQLEDMLIRYLPKELIKEKEAKPQEPKNDVKPEEKASEESGVTNAAATEAAAAPGAPAAAAGAEGKENEVEAGAPAADTAGAGADASADDGGTFVDRLAKAGFNIEEAHSFTMDDDEFYLELLETYINGIEEKEGGIRKSYEEKDWKNYQVLVHGLKSSSRTIGADHLADLALAQEMASKEQDVEKIDAGLEELLTTYHEITEVIRNAIGK